MVNFYILLFLCLITGSNSTLHDDFNINSKLKSALMKNNGTIFSKKLENLGGKTIESRTFNNRPSTGNRDIITSFRSGSKLLCRTRLSRLESKRCKPLCYNGKCYNFCSLIRERCTY